MKDYCSTAKKVLLAFLFCIMAMALRAQVEVAQLILKNHSSTGFGVYLNAEGAISPHNQVGGELGFYYFNNKSDHLAVFPLLACWRHTFSDNNNGIYIEPGAGYSFGGTDIPKRDKDGAIMYNGDEQLNQKVSGPAAAFSAGYLFPNIPLQVGLRFTHIFVSGDPAPTIASLRVSYVVAFKRRKGK